MFNGRQTATPTSGQRVFGTPLRPTSSVIVSRADSLISLAPHLDDLYAVSKSPVTARRSWWRAAVDADPSATPIVLTQPGPEGTLDAAAFLMMSEEDGGTRVLRSYRARSDDVWEIAGRSPLVRRRLAVELAQAIRSLAHPWRLVLTGLRDGDVTLDVLREHLPECLVLRAEPVPRVRFEHQQTAAAVVRPSVRAALHRSGRRIATDGLSETVEFERRHLALLEMRAQIEAAHRARDHDAGRVSDLDAPANYRFWRSAFDNHAARGELEVATLRLGGELAAYVVSFLDPPAYRVFDGRFVPAFRRYSPGRRLEVSVLERVSRDGSLRELDWMSSVAPEQLIAATGADRRWTLVAGSETPAPRMLALVASSGS
jgi:CelD/BcsL family acetyltransferase involved in cellulose biosynthesis